MYGWSYGGYMACMSLCKSPIFKVCVAGAPVTSWDGYDTHYTERYMGTPESNKHGYKISSIFEHVHKMEGKLLLVHGFIDENVHFRHTARLINALIQENKVSGTRIREPKITNINPLNLIRSAQDYDLLVFPDERHSPRSVQDRLYLERRLCAYFSVNL